MVTIINPEFEKEYSIRMNDDGTLTFLKKPENNTRTPEQVLDDNQTNTPPPPPLVEIAETDFYALFGYIKN